ncbi:ATP-binding protein [Flavobacteriaceae bacterium AH-315-B10]|nr:ATP-binding protein [Flavobacteriaceae bacterium AH-315-B10]
MKSVKTSFLFFCTSFISISFLFSVYAQQKIDSTWYYHKLIVKPESNSDLISGFAFFDKHKEQSLNKKDTLRAVYDLRMIIISQTDLGLPYQAEASIVEALNLMDHIKLVDSAVIDNKIGLYISLGVIYRLIKNYDKAIGIYDKALEIVDNDNIRLKLYNNKANVYKSQGQLISSEKEFEIVYNERLKFDTKLNIAKALDNLGSVQGKLGKAIGLTNMLKVLEIRMVEKDFQNYYSSYTNLREYYKDLNDIKNAKYYAKLGYEAAILYSESNKLDALSRLLELRNDSLVVKHIRMNDSITDGRLSNDNKYSSAKYNLDKEQKRTLQNELLAVKERSKKIIYQFLGSLVLLISIFLYFILKSKYKKEKRKEVLNTEANISKKIHDELANDVFQVMTQLQNTPKANEKIINDLDQIYSKTRDISLEYSALDVKDNFNVLLKDLLLSYNSDTVNVITKGITEIHWESVSEIKKTTIYKILQELMINMKKHSKATVTVLSFNETRKKISISYNDNGIGCELKKNTGLINVENRISSIKGSVIFESEIKKGFKVKITV